MSSVESVDSIIDSSIAGDYRVGTYGPERLSCSNSTFGLFPSCHQRGAQRGANRFDLASTAIWLSTSSLSMSAC